MVVCLGHVDVEGGLVRLAPRLQGRVKEVAVEEGDSVRAGKVLVRLDDGEARQAVAVARAGLHAAEARLAQARQDEGLRRPRLAQLRSSLKAVEHRLAGARSQLKRQEHMFAQKLVGPFEVSAAREQVREVESLAEAARARLAEAEVADPALAVRAADAEVEAARARVGQAEQALRGLEVRAPSAGRALTVSARVGEVAGPGGEAAVLFCPDRALVVRVEVEQELVARLGPGQAAEARDELSGAGPWPGTVVLVGGLYSRRLSRTDPTQLSDVPTVECLVRLTGPRPPVRVGQRLRVAFFNRQAAGPR